MPRWFASSMWMISTLVLWTFTTALPAFANILISVDKSTQQMSVSVDGVPRYRFAVSTGRAGYGTPNGTYHPQRLAASWFSKLYYNSPMPHSIFFHGGYAIHGSYDINRLGGPASHGCIRLHPANAGSSFRFGEKRRYGRQRLLLYPGATRSSRAVPLRLHALIAEGRALPMTNATGVIMRGGNLLTTTATGLITDGKGLPMATLTGLITDAPIITGVQSRGCHRSSIRTDPPSRGLRLPGCLKEASS